MLSENRLTIDNSRIGPLLCKDTRSTVVLVTVCCGGIYKRHLGLVLCQSGYRLFLQTPESQVSDFADERCCVAIGSRHEPSNFYRTHENWLIETNSCLSFLSQKLDSSTELPENGCCDRDGPIVSSVRET